MKAKLTLRYDKVGDILYIDKCPPYKEQDSEELAEEIGVRLNPSTGDIETVEINFFSRLNGDSSIDLPVSATLRISDS